jgi:hypothetical protein
MEEVKRKFKEMVFQDEKFLLWNAEIADDLENNEEFEVLNGFNLYEGGLAPKLDAEYFSVQQTDDFDIAGNERDFKVYRNGEFVDATSEEDSYLRNLEDEEGFYFLEQEEVLSISYNDWAKENGKELIEESVSKETETENFKYLKTFENFKSK